MENLIHKTSRAFNQVTIDKKRGLVHKRSKDYEKLLAEAFWYKNLPAELGAFTPKLLWEDVESSEIVLEYCPYITLSEHLTSTSNGLCYYAGDYFMKNALQRLLEVHEMFQEQTALIDKESLIEFHVAKTISRVKQLEENEFFRSMLSQKVFWINDKKYDNLDVKRLLEDLRKSQNLAKPSVVHGDYCLSNILYDFSSDSVKLIDPRGYWMIKDKPTIYGDAHYDYAKLLHSVHGLYDFIVQDRYSWIQLDYNRYSFSIDFQDSFLQSQLMNIMGERLVDEDIFRYRRLLEVLLFVTMIPLHYEDQKRQFAFYLRAVQLYNELYDNLN